MPQKYSPLTPSDIVSILEAAAFRFKIQEGSHAHYVAFIHGIARKVTVKMNVTEFNDFLIKSMIHQSGLSREEFYGSTKSTAKKINLR